MPYRGNPVVGSNPTLSASSRRGSSGRLDGAVQSRPGVLAEPGPHAEPGQAHDQQGADHRVQLPAVQVAVARGDLAVEGLLVDLDPRAQGAVEGGEVALRVVRR